MPPSRRAYLPSWPLTLLSRPKPPAIRLCRTVATYRVGEPWSSDYGLPKSVQAKQVARSTRSDLQIMRPELGQYAGAAACLLRARYTCRRELANQIQLPESARVISTQGGAGWAWLCPAPLAGIISRTNGLARPTPERRPTSQPSTR
jgi:hypothetical protein